jgi:hypothetical protein
LAACLAGWVDRPMTTSRSAPLTERYSNPGAVEFKPWMQRYGATVGPNGRYAQFPNQDAGYAVMGKILDTYQNKHGLNTVSGIVNRWAPSNVDNNSTSTYIAKVAAAVGIDPNQPITPEQRPVLMKAMADYEAGRAQPAPNGAAPKMWPPAGQLDPNSPLASLMGMYGREASTAPGPIVLPQQQSAPAVASASYRAPERAPQKQEEGTLASIVRGLTQSMNSPLFQAGAAMVDAGSRGQNIGAGFLAGGQAASAAAQQAAAMRKSQQEELAQAQRQRFWGELTTDPAKAKMLPEGTLDFIRALGPIDGPKVAMELVRGNQIGALDRMKLDELRKKNADQAQAHGIRTVKEGETLLWVPRAPGQQPEVIFGGQSNAADKEFDKTLGKGLADDFRAEVARFPATQQTLGKVNVMKQLSASIGQPGIVNSLAAGPLGRAARAVGLQPEQMASIESWTAMVSQMVPSQRPPGSGTMSDKDVDLFKESLPALAATKEGRDFILAQMEGIARYDEQRARIAQEVVTKRMTRAQAIDQMMQLPNPLAELSKNIEQYGIRVPGRAGAPPTTGGGGGQRYVNPQTGEVVQWNGQAYVSVGGGQSMPTADARGIPYPPASR